MGGKGLEEGSDEPGSSFPYWDIIYNRRTMQPLPFERFSGSYTVLGELGRGASGICYHIVTTNDRRHYALKKIPLHLVDAKKLPAELTLLSMVQHPNIIRLQQSYLSKDFLYLLFDYTQQRDLQKVIKQRERLDDHFKEGMLWGYVRQLLEALIYLHGQGILHRDVKPSNIFVDNEGALQLGDLGSAKIAEKENYTRIGTPLYLAPEIIKYEAYSEKVDIWSLGVTLFQLAALKPPFHNPNFIKLAQSITYEEPQYPLHFSKRLKAVIAEMLRKDPSQRPTADDLLQKYFITPIQSPPEEKETPMASLHSLAIEQAKDLNELLEEQQEDAEWEVQLCGIRQPQRRVTKISHRSSIDEDHGHVPSIKTLGRASSRRLASRESRQDEIRECSGSLSRSQLQDGDDTIVLQVDPNDCANFCGYYRESPRPSRIHFVPSDTSNTLRMGRKSSLFKQGPEPELQNPSHFKSSHTKENRSSLHTEPVATHRRQESLIGAKQKHGELMSSLRPSRHGRQEQVRSVVQQPELIIIDLKPLLLPYYNQRSSID